MLSERIKHRNGLIISVIAFVIVFILWNVPAFDGLMYPFRLFVTYIHEAGHGLAAILTGGRIAGFVVSADGSGVATTIGGSRALILPAGYLGAAFFGAALFYTINTIRYPRTISIVLGVGLIVFSVLFARPDRSGVPLALLVGLAFGFALIGIGWKVRRSFNLLLLNIVAMVTSLNAVMDVFTLTNNTGITVATGTGVIRNDAAAFSAEVAPLIPAGVWAVLWAALAVMMLAVAVYYSVIRPLKDGEIV